MRRNKMKWIERNKILNHGGKVRFIALHGHYFLLLYFEYISDCTFSLLLTTFNVFFLDKNLYFYLSTECVYFHYL